MPFVLSLITHPISLCAYIISLAFALLAKKKKDSRVFYLTAFLSIFALLGGFFLAWQQLNGDQKQSSVPVSSTNQTSHGEQSPNISGVEGDVKIEFGDTTPGKKIEK
jgi:hypothetical protein